jgi:hypothetical protein
VIMLILVQSAYGIHSDTGEIKVDNNTVKKV